MCCWRCSEKTPGGALALAWSRGYMIKKNKLVSGHSGAYRKKTQQNKESAKKDKPDRTTAH
jgi:hypothetical protein